jgi:BMFP domain-containing protein YqiC
MQTKNPMLDDLSKIATNALGALQGAKAEVERMARQQVERMVAQMNLVSRDEFDALKAVAAAARADNERLAEQFAALAARLESRPARKRATGAKRGAKKAKAA